MPLLFAADAPDRSTVKDALAHLNVLWKAHEGRKAMINRSPVRREPHGGADVNHNVYMLWRDMPANDVVAWHHQAHQQVMRP